MTNVTCKYRKKEYIDMKKYFLSGDFFYTFCTFKLRWNGKFPFNCSGTCKINFVKERQLVRLMFAGDWLGSFKICTRFLQNFDDFTIGHTLLLYDNCLKKGRWSIALKEYLKFVLTCHYNLNDLIYKDILLSLTFLNILLKYG